METKFNFKSQICSSREQSERLLKLGLKKETADFPVWGTEKLLYMGWSLHRLLELNLLCCEQHFAFKFHITNIDNAYEYLINHTEWLIKEGYFNKEYLEE